MRFLVILVSLVIMLIPIKNIMWYAKEIILQLSRFLCLYFFLCLWS